MIVQEPKWVTACIPYYRCLRYVARAVEGLLAQTYPWIRIIVINDGDHATPPWPALAHINDPRLVRFTVPRNKGPYFCLEVARRATPDPLFLIQDADDWSAPTRVETLLATLYEQDADLAISSQPQFCEHPDGSLYEAEVLWDCLASETSGKRLALDSNITPQYRYRSPHHGLFRSSALRDIGGYYGGFRINWDVILTNLILMTGRISWTPLPLYHRFLRADSLSHARQTGTGSPHAMAVRELVRQLYIDCHQEYYAALQGGWKRELYLDRLRRVSLRNVPSDDWSALARHAQRLQDVMCQ